MRAGGLVVALIALMSVPQVARGLAVRVPDEYPTIQEGIDAVSNGDTVLVAAQTYTGPGNRDLDFGGTNLVLVSEGGSGVTTIDCESLDRGFNFHNGEDSSAVVCGFTVANGQQDWGGAVRIYGNSAPRFQDCVFLGNSARGGGAVYAECDYGWQPAFVDCSFFGNKAVGHGGALNCWDSALTIRACTFSGNSGAYGGGLYCGVMGEFPTIQGCTFDSNEAIYDGGAMFIDNYISSPRGGSVDGPVAPSSGSRQFWNPAWDCVFSSNLAGRMGGGICCVDNVGGSYLEIVGATFIGNCAPSGGGLADEMAALSIRECTFSRNSADQGGGVFFYHWCPQLGVTNCTFSLNSAPEGACISWGSSSNRPISNVVFAFSAEGAPVHCPAGDPIITHCIVYGNAGGDVLCGDHHDNLVADPLFCDVYNDDVALCGNSPCLSDGNSWGELVGAHGQGCGDCSAPVVPVTWASMKAMFR